MAVSGTRPRARAALRQSIRAAFRRIGYDLYRRYPPGLTVEDHLRALLPAIGIDCVIDVGAHHGEFGVRLRASGYRGRIVSFEPVAAAYAALAAVASRDPNWIVANLGLGRASGRTTLNVSENTQFSSFLAPETDVVEAMPGAAVARTEDVAVERLDDVFATYVPGPASRVFLKLDTQGWDLEVIAGATTSIRSIVALQSEISVRPVYQGMPHYLEALARYEELGFELTGLFPVARDARLRLIELDCVMVRPAALP